MEHFCHATNKFHQTKQSLHPGYCKLHTHKPFTPSRFRARTAQLFTCAALPFCIPKNPLSEFKLTCRGGRRQRGASNRVMNLSAPKCKASFHSCRVRLKATKAKLCFAWPREDRVIVLPLVPQNWCHAQSLLVALRTFARNCEKKCVTESFTPPPRCSCFFYFLFFFFFLRA